MHSYIEHAKNLLMPRFNFLADQRKLWGVKGDVDRPRRDRALLYDLTKARYGQKVDDDTWIDLDMEQIIGQIDQCATPIGSQYLYRKLRIFESDPEILRSDFEAAMSLKTDTELREKIQLVLFALNHPDASRVAKMLYDKPPEAHFPTKVIPIMALSVPISGLLAAFSLIPLWGPVIFALMNLIFAQKYANAISWYSTGFFYLRYLLYATMMIVEIKGGEKVGPIQKLREIKSSFPRLAKKSRFVGSDANSGVSLNAAYGKYFLNIFCLFDFIVFLKSRKLLAEHGDEFREIFEGIGALDAAISVASYCCWNENYINPKFNDNAKMEFKSVRHPLLEDAVENSYDNQGKSALITGSNMAGKTTFIKTIGVNVILGQTIWICHAREASISMGPVYSSIKRADSLLEGKSYFRREIDALLRFTKCTSNDGGYALFLIDEILRGTNTVERLAASTAILEELSQSGTVLVTSHDVELCELLPNRFTLYHFQETGDINEMYDYKIRDGRITTRNAISLLDQIGFPSKIVKKALDIAKQLDG